MNHRIYKIQLLKILVQNVSGLAVWVAIGTNVHAAQNVLLKEEVSKIVTPSPATAELSFPIPSSTPFLIGGPDNFKPGLNGPKLTEPDSQSETVGDPTEQLGWPQLSDAEKRRKAEQEQRNKAQEIEKQRRILELEQKIKQRLEREQKRALEQETRLQQNQERKRKEALIRAQEREEAQERKRLRAAEIERKQQEELEKEQKKKLVREAKRKEKEELKQRRKLAKVQEDKNKSPLIAPKTLTIDYSRSANSSGQVNQTIDSTAIFELFNKDTLSVNTGFNTYIQSTVEPIQNIPLKLGWERQIGQYTVSVTAGIDWYDRVPIAPSFKATAKTPIQIPTKLGKALLVSAEVDYGSYKFNAETIQNQIQYLRLRGSLFWQIDSKTSFFSIDYFGRLNDGNQELQSFNRLERKIGKFSVAGNLFAWSFQKDLSKQSGYFSPPDFLVYNAEVAWEDKITKFLSCRLSASLGQQRANGKFSNANTLQALCSATITKNIDFDFGYAFSNIFTGTNVGGGSANTNTFTGQLRIRF